MVAGFGPCYRSKRGYGTYATVKKGSQFAHRICYELCFGLVPPKMHLHHKCENPPCCNPAHLEVLTAKEHHQKSPKFLAVQPSTWTHCIHGHAFDEGNTYISNAGKRMCRICLRDRMRESRARALAANPKPPKMEPTHCIWGHALSGDNVAVVKKLDKQVRVCKTCRRRNDAKREGRVFYGPT